jgi:hypothetical protein
MCHKEAHCRDLMVLRTLLVVRRIINEGFIGVFDDSRDVSDKSASRLHRTLLLAGSKAATRIKERPRASEHPLWVGAESKGCRQATLLLKFLASVHVAS